LHIHVSELCIRVNNIKHVTHDIAKAVVTTVEYDTTKIRGGHDFAATRYNTLGGI